MTCGVLCSQTRKQEETAAFATIHLCILTRSQISFRKGNIVIFNNVHSVGLYYNNAFWASKWPCDKFS